jgi:acetylornithine/succinyldiaminopimelate/putrescine aminotransferase
MIEREGLLEQARRISDRFRGQLDGLARECDLVRELRMLGLMIGIELAVDGAPLVQACLERGLLINCTHGHVLRLLPAMNLAPAQVDEGCAILAEVLRRHTL